MVILCTDATPSFLNVFDFGVAPQLLFYSYIPIIIVSLFFGCFVFLKNKTSSQGKLLFIISIIFSIFLINEIVQWISVPAGLVNFSWRLAALCQYLIWLFSFLFFLNFIGETRGYFWEKSVIIFLGLPIIILLPTNFNLKYFDLDTCGGIIGGMWTYLYLFQIISIIFLLVFGIIRYSKEKNEIIKKKILLITIGMFCFLSFFAASNIFGEILKTYDINLIGPIGMIALLSLLTYLIVKFKAFNIKLLAAQALVIAIIVLIGSQFFFIKSTTNMFLNGITFILSSIFGWWLVRSVKTENARREQLQYLADQLAGSNSKLQKMDNTKTEFISIASHQLRTPPTAIKGYTSLLLEGSYGKLQPDQLYALNNIYRRNEDMILLIDNLLNTSRIEAGTMAFDFEKFKMEDLLQDIYETLIIKAKTNKLSLEIIKPTTAIPEVTTDKAKFKETLSNLVENAIKYTKQGGVKVEAGLQKGFTVLSHESSNPTPIAGAELRYPEKNVVRIVVSDTGIGIPENELPFLFQKFSRGKDITRLNVSGTGLGLFVGKKIMEELGGQVWAESKGAGKGSRFIVEIPVEGKEKK